MPLVISVVLKAYLLLFYVCQPMIMPICACPPQQPTHLHECLYNSSLYPEINYPSSQKTERQLGTPPAHRFQTPALQNSFLRLLGWLRLRVWWLKNVCMVLRRDYLSIIQLLADDSIGDPRLLQNFTHRRPFLWIELEHAPDNVPTFPGQEPKNPPRAPDDLLLIARSLCLGLWR
jgi:hypothetical protein